MSELEKVKLQLGITDNTQDSLLTLLLEDAQAMIDDTVNKGDTMLAREAVIYAYNQRGAEGNKSHSSGGFSMSFYYDSMSSFIASKSPNKWVIK